MIVVIKLRNRARIYFGNLRLVQTENKACGGKREKQSRRLRLKVESVKKWSKAKILVLCRKGLKLKYFKIFAWFRLKAVSKKSGK